MQMGGDVKTVWHNSGNFTFVSSYIESIMILKDDSAVGWTDYNNKNFFPDDRVWYPRLQLRMEKGVEMG